MAEWRIVCVKKKNVEKPTPHPHIANVGTGDRPDWADMRWELDQVFYAMQEGDTFTLQSALDGRILLIEQYTCTACGQLDICIVGEGGVEQRQINLRECIYQY